MTGAGAMGAAGAATALEEAELLLPVAEPAADAAGAAVVGVANRDRIERSLICGAKED